MNVLILIVTVWAVLGYFVGLRYQVSTSRNVYLMIVFGPAILLGVFYLASYLLKGLP